MNDLSRSDRKHFTKRSWDGVGTGRLVRGRAESGLLIDITPEFAE
jgi:hypothetical protein